MPKQTKKPALIPCRVYDCGGRKYAAVIQPSGQIAYVIDGKTQYLSLSQIRDERWTVER